VERSPEPWLGPFPHLIKRIDALAAEHEAELIVVDPAVPLGLIAPHFDLPYAVVLHGAEVTIPARVPGSRRALRHVLEKATFVISAGQYALDEAELCVGANLKSVVIPPGVDTERFAPLGEAERESARLKFRIQESDIVLATVNRLVPRKGMGLLVAAVAEAAQTVPDLRALIGGSGRETKRLQAQISSLSAPVEMLGRISDADVADLYGAADLMAMLCTSRWGGLEQEGFGIVFLEAAAAGLPQIAGRSGGAAEAVIDGGTGFIVNAEDQQSVVEAIIQLATNTEMRQTFGAAARQRAVDSFEYDLLAEQLEKALDSFGHHKEG
jgi:phosphatidylinositol alpha-1,6-mannosyltransferase